MTGGPVLAIDMGGTNIRAAIVAGDGAVLAIRGCPTPAQESAAAVVEAIGALCDVLIAACPLDPRAPAGLCAPGPLDADNGVALGTPTIAALRDFPLRDRLAQRLGRPVTIDNDGHAAAYGEWHCGAAPGQRNFVFVTVSTGIGGGVVLDGRLLRGRMGMAGHFGHMLLGDPGDICFCGAAGCWEATASGTALQRRARAAGFGSLQDACDASHGGDISARAFLDRAARDLARGLVTLAHCFSPDSFVLGGGVMSQFATLDPLIRRHFRTLCLPPFRETAFHKARLADHAGLIGMAMQISHRDKAARGISGQRGAG
ncbi:ROK family protein [Paracoccus sp. (in: a-proteobacteria)]|uniref:ROK family protein n=1 Tax=Paracoccus sp. TaxID=267 RepID=UPI003A87DF6A